MISDFKKKVAKIIRIFIDLSPSFPVPGVNTLRSHTSKLSLPFAVRAALAHNEEKIRCPPPRFAASLPSPQGPALARPGWEVAWEALSQGDPPPGVGGLAQDQGSDAEAPGQLGWAGPAGWVGRVGWESEGSKRGSREPLSTHSNSQSWSSVISERRLSWDVRRDA